MNLDQKNKNFEELLKLYITSQKIQLKRRGG